MTPPPLSPLSTKSVQSVVTRLRIFRHAGRRRQDVTCHQQEAELRTSADVTGMRTSADVESIGSVRVSMSTASLLPSDLERDMTALLACRPATNKMDGHFRTN